MGQLSKLPNIGKVVEEQLIQVGITTLDDLKNIGITVMDGPFFSIMPFGQTGLHSLTSVTFTPHMIYQVL